MDDTQNESAVAVAEPKARYTSHPITNFRLGRFRFNKGQLALDNSDDVSEFEKLLDSLPVVEQMKVRKIDLAAAERISAEYQARQGGPTKNTDSSTGERATPKVGTGKLGDPNPEAFANQAQMDMNRPVSPEKMDEPLAGKETSGESKIENPVPEEAKERGEGQGLPAFMQGKK